MLNNLVDNLNTHLDWHNTNGTFGK